MKRLATILVVMTFGLAGCGSTAIQTVTVHKAVAIHATHRVTHPAIPRRAIVTPPAETHEAMCHRKFQESPPKSEQEAFVMYKEYGCNEAEALGMKPPSRAEAESARLQEIRNHTSPNEMSRGEEAERSQEQREERSRAESCYKYGERESNPGCP